MLRQTLLYLFILSSFAGNSQTFFSSNYNNFGSANIDLGIGYNSKTKGRLYHLGGNLRYKYAKIGFNITEDDERTNNSSLRLGYSHPIHHLKYATSSFNIDGIYNYTTNRTFDQSVNSFGIEANLRFNTTISNFQIGYNWSPRAKLENFNSSGFFIRVAAGINKFAIFLEGFRFANQERVSEEDYIARWLKKKGKYPIANKSKKENTYKKTKSTKKYYYDEYPREKEKKARTTTPSTYSYEKNGNNNSESHNSYSNTHYSDYGSEHSYVKIINKKFNGQLEAYVPGGKVDILTSSHAIEVDFAKKFKEAIGQSEFYSTQTGKTAGIVLILRNESERKYLDYLKSTIENQRNNIKVWVFPDDFHYEISTSNSYRSYQSTPNLSTGSYWLNTNGGVRHNSSCRWYGNTKKGRFCTDSEGKAGGCCGG